MEKESEGEGEWEGKRKAFALSYHEPKHNQMCPTMLHNKEDDGV